MRLFLAVPCAVALSCATAPEAPEKPPPPRPAARSSIDAVVSHRSELELTDDQVTRLQVIDDERERKASELRAELHAAAEQGGGAPRGGPRAGPASGNGQPGGLAPNAAPPGMGTGGMGGMGGRGGMGRGGRQGPMGPMPEAKEAHQVWQRLDDVDTQAYLSCEGIFTPAQWERAGLIATKYREELYNFREAMRRRRLPAE